MTIRAVFFDMGGTIQTYCHTPELRLKATPGLQKTLLDVGIDLDLTDEQLYETVAAGLEAYHAWRLHTNQELPTLRVWRDYILADFEEANLLTNQSAEKLMFYVDTKYYHREMRPEIPSVLHAIQQMGLKMGLISNVCSHGQVPANLHEYGIDEYFDPIVISSVYGRRKPDASIFHYAARMAHVPTSECVYIGDRINRDIIGAKNAGFRLAIQIQHDFDHGEEDFGAIPDAIIGNMTELLELLRVQLAQPKAAQPHFISAIFFDAGDILYHRPHRKAKFNQFLKDLALDANDIPIVDTRDLSHKAYCGLIDPDEFYDSYLRLFGVTGAERLNRGKQILIEEENDVEFFEGVRETLISLKKQGFYLGIITDTFNSVHTKLNWFERGGFCQVWDSIISSNELGVCKPNPAIYHAALRQLGVPAWKAAFVGHKSSELDGARAVGMKTIAFNYDPDARADYFIANFCELLEVPILAQMLYPGKI